MQVINSSVFILSSLKAVRSCLEIFSIFSYLTLGAFFMVIKDFIIIELDSSVIVLSSYKAVNRCFEINYNKANLIYLKRN